VPIPAFEQDIAENEKRSRSLFENFMQEHGVPRGGDTKALSSAWLDNALEGDHFVGSHGRVFDAIVLGKPGRDPKGPRMATLEAGLFESGRPVLIAPLTPQPQMGTNVLIAWNCSTEQARVTGLLCFLLEHNTRRSAGDAALRNFDVAYVRSGSHSRPRGRSHTTAHVRFAPKAIVSGQT
jgi:hypothetical protein